MKFNNFNIKQNLTNSNNIYNYSVKNYKNESISLSKYDNYKAIIIVNVASNWGLAQQNYEELQYLYKKYEDLIVLGFPSNQFGNQEPKSNKEIQEFVKNKNVTFPVFAKIDVNGSKEDPLYTYLKNKKRGFLSKDITWNYTKFLCIDGVPVKRYGPQENPKSFENDIKKYI